MHLIEIFLPLYDNHGNPFPREAFDEVREELAASFGGVTAFHRSPAEGVWKDDRGRESRDHIVIHEVMVDDVDPGFWAAYRKKLERRFEQESIVIRASDIRML